MSKQSKKQKKRRNRQNKRRRHNLITLFDALYPNAPANMAQRIIDDYLAGQNPADFSHLSNTETVQVATVTYVRQNLTRYQQRVDQFIDAVLDSLAAGEAYMDQTAHSLEEEPTKQAKIIINTWKAKI